MKDIATYPIHASEKLLSVNDICNLIGCNRVTLWRMTRDGRFPKPLEILPKKRAWPASDYENWKAQHVALRDAKANRMGA